MGTEIVQYSKPCAATMVLRGIHGSLKDDGNLIVVEYNTDRGNRWVPFPLSYGTWQRLAERSGFTASRRLHAVQNHINHRTASLEHTLDR